jgi:hypothetical protein
LLAHVGELGAQEGGHLFQSRDLRLKAGHVALPRVDVSDGQMGAV